MSRFMISSLGNGPVSRWNRFASDAAPKARQIFLRERSSAANAAVHRGASAHRLTPVAGKLSPLRGFRTPTSIRLGCRQAIDTVTRS
jgi:hypothetical protein